MNNHNNRNDSETSLREMLANFVNKPITENFEEKLVDINAGIEEIWGSSKTTKSNINSLKELTNNLYRSNNYLLQQLESLVENQETNNTTQNKISENIGITLKSIIDIDKKEESRFNQSIILHKENIEQISKHLFLLEEKLTHNTNTEKENLITLQALIQEIKSTSLSSHENISDKIDALHSQQLAERLGQLEQLQRRHLNWQLTIGVAVVIGVVVMLVQVW